MKIAMAIAVAWGLSTTGAWGQTTTGSGQTTRSGAKYDVTLKAGTTDAANWKAKAGDGELKALPLEGVAEGQTVTLKYDGRKRVKRVTAVKQTAAYQARNYTGLTAPAGTTGWFLPSAQQWVKMLEGLGGLAEGDIKWRSWFNNDHTAADKWETAMAKAGTKGTAYDSVTDDYLWYWSSSEYSASIAVSLLVDATGTGTGYGFYWNNDNKDGSNTDDRIRPVLAF